MTARTNEALLVSTEELFSLMQAGIQHPDPEVRCAAECILSILVRNMRNRQTVVSAEAIPYLRTLDTRARDGVQFDTGA